MYLMKNYVIIGASSGIGNSIAVLLSEENHNVIGTYNNSNAEHSPKIQYHQLNVLEEQIDFSFLPEVVDGLVYCPGAINLKPFSRAKPEDFIQDYQLQVIGAIKCIQATLPYLKKSENPSIILFSTVAAQMGFNFHSIVSASKGAIEGLTKSLAAEFSPKIRINCIAPSITKTRLAASLLNTEEKQEASAQRHPLKKIGKPEDISNMVAFLLSEKATWITGQIFHVDGGISSIKS